MFTIERSTSKLGSAFSLAELIYHATVRNIRKSHGNAVIGLLMNMFQTALMVAAFYLMFDILGLRQLSIRGDFLLFVMSGIFLFMTHTKTVSAVSGAEGSTSPMMKHAPMNTFVAIASAALSALYLQVLSAALVLYFYHAAIKPLHIHDLVGMLGIFLLTWYSGIGIGMLFLSIRPWAPEVASMLTTIYQRVNMIASGKMFVVNMMPGTVIALFDWNPLFHCIDQARGQMFLNYDPRYTSVTYPVVVTTVLLMLALMAEFYTRRHASLSWSVGK